jgi:methyl-accepting chemotaxis protein
MSEGDMNVEMETASEDEIGRLSVSFNRMVKDIKKSLGEVHEKSRIAETAAKEAEEAKAGIQAQQEYMASNTKALLHEMEKFSNGDLTVGLKTEKNDEMGKLILGFNDSVKNIKNMLEHVLLAVEATASAANEISSSSEQMSSGAQEQSAQTSDVADAVGQMNKTIFDTAKIVTGAAGLADKASSDARKGRKKIEQTKTGMEKIVAAAKETGVIINSLSRKTDQIGEITQVINDVADQTNLLALNAAIEAARAGEQGRGFAVVADEVRKLAERTSKATGEIAATIKTIQEEAKRADKSMGAAEKAVEEGMVMTAEVMTVLEEILESSKGVNDAITQVAAASQEQSSAAEQITKNIEGISSVTQESAAGIQEIARAAGDLSDLTINLQQLVNKFKIG